MAGFGLDLGLPGDFEEQDPYRLPDLNRASSTPVEGFSRYQPQQPQGDIGMGLEAMGLTLEEEQGIMADFIDKVQEGSYSAAADILTGVRGLLTDDKVWAMENALRQGAASQQDTLSATQREADANFGLFGDDKEFSGRGLMGAIGSGIGSVGPSMLLGGGAGMAARGLAAAAGAGRVGQAAAAAAGAGTAGAPMIGGGAMNDVAVQLESMTPEELQTIPEFAPYIDAAVNGLPGDPDAAMRAAKAAYMQDAQQEAVQQGAALGALSMAIAGPALEKLVKGGYGVLQGAKVGGITETGQEAVESGGQRAIVNPIVGEERWAGVPEEAVTGGLLGGIIGGGLGGARGALPGAGVEPMPEVVPGEPTVTPGQMGESTVTGTHPMYPVQEEMDLQGYPIQQEMDLQGGIQPTQVPGGVPLDIDNTGLPYADNQLDMFNTEEQLDLLNPPPVEPTAGPAPVGPQIQPELPLQGGVQPEPKMAFDDLIQGVEQLGLDLAPAQAELPLGEQAPYQPELPLPAGEAVTPAAMPIGPDQETVEAAQGDLFQRQAGTPEQAALPFAEPTPLADTGAAGTLDKPYDESFNDWIKRVPEEDTLKPVNRMFEGDLMDKFRAKDNAGAAVVPYTRDVLQETAKMLGVPTGGNKTDLGRRIRQELADRETAPDQNKENKTRNRIQQQNFANQIVGRAGAGETISEKAGSQAAALTNARYKKLLERQQDKPAPRVKTAEKPKPEPRKKTGQMTDQYVNYAEEINRLKGNIPAGMQEQIEADERLDDGEAERLMKRAYNQRIKAQEEKRGKDMKGLLTPEEAPEQPAPRKKTEPMPGTTAATPEEAAALEARKAEKPKNYGEKNKVFTASAAEKARARMRSKMGTLRSGLDPEMLADGITLAGFHIEAGARKFSDYSKAMIADLGEDIKPYLLSFYNGARDFPGFDSEGMSSNTVARIQQNKLMETVPAKEAEQPAPVKETKQGPVPLSKFDNVKTNADLRKLTANRTDLELKQVQEEYEAYQVKKARDIVGQGMDQKKTYDALVDLYNNQINMDVRTADSMELQAYSTPAPLAYMTSRATDIGQNTTVYEPTAGNGMLLIEANPEKTQVNEIDPDRAQALRDQGFAVTEESALNYQPKKAVQVVTMNPPFGKRQGVAKIDHEITLDALDAMKKDGKASVIIGAPKEKGVGVARNEREFFNELFTDYNVTDIYEVAGDLYSRQGAAWPVRVITIEGKNTDGKKRIAPLGKDVKRLTTWDQVYERRTGNERTVGREVSGRNLSDIFGREGNIPGVKGGKPAGPKDTGRAAATAEGERGGRVKTADAGRKPTGPGKPVSRTGATGEQYRGKPDDRRTTTPDEKGAKPGSQAAARSDQKAAAARPRDDVNESDFQASYPVRSKGSNVEVRMPTNMLEAHKKAVAKLEKAVGGDIDQFVVDKLQYKSKEEMFDKLMGLQVESVASAIYNIEHKTNKGIIIADQTGIGKGRQAAALIRYARLNGKTPVFVTVGGNLFSDMYSDLKNIGEKPEDINPFIFNQDGADVTEMNDDGVVDTVIKPLRNVPGKGKPKYRADAFARMIQDGSLPEGMNSIFTTYSQFNNQPSKTFPQRQALQKVKDPLFILDEAHTAAGDREKRVKVGGEWDLQDMLAGFFDKVTRDKAAVYLSATWAKRADNIPLYHRTDMLDAVDNVEDLITAIEAGGNPLQIVLSSMLTESGQLFRRERGFDGINFDRETIKDNPEQQKKDFNALANGLSAVNNADRLYQAMVVPQLNEIAEAEGLADVTGGSNASQTIGMPNSFASSLHNYASQFTMASKVDALVDRVVKDVTAKQKVKYLDGTTKNETQKAYVGLENTMAAGINAIIEQHNLVPGDEFPYSFNDILKTALLRTRMIAIKDSDTNKKVGEVEITMDMLKRYDSLAWQAYKTAEKTIDALNISDIPVSPIDYFLQKMEDAGVKTGEMTGRKVGLDYSGDVPTIKTFGKRNKNTTINKFNTGKIDAIIGNATTGFSIHASEDKKVTDKRQRHMYIVQPPKDINELMQMLGRVNRTGQVVKPEYTMLSLDVPSEQRTAIMTAKKMASLNANTSANEESDLSLNIPDFINKYGNGVANAFLQERPDIAAKVHMSGAVSEDFDLTKGMAGNTMSQLTGRLALLDVDTQQAVLQELSANYTDLIDTLTSTGQNDLIVKDVDLQAKVKSSEVIHEGTGKSIFDADTVLHEVDANWVGSFLEPGKVEKAIEKATPVDVANVAAQDTKIEVGLQDEIRRVREAPTSEEEDSADLSAAQQKNLLDKSEASLKAYNDIKNSTLQGVRNFKPGTRVSFEDGELGVVVDMQYVNTGKGNPYSPSKVKLKVAVNQGVGMLNTSLSYISKAAEPMQRQNAQLEDIFYKPLGKQKRYVATGNPLMAVNKLAKQGGKVVNFTDDQGKSHTGVLLPSSVEKVANSSFKANDPKVLRKYLEDNPGTVVSTDDGSVKATMAGGSLVIKVPKSDKSPTSKKVKYDKPLRQAMGTQFAGKNATMTATVTGNIQDSLEKLMDLVALNISTENRADWEAAGGAKPKEATGKFDDTMVPAEVVPEKKTPAKKAPEPTKKAPPKYAKEPKKPRQTGIPSGQTRAGLNAELAKQFGKTHKNIETVAKQSDLPPHIQDPDSTIRGAYDPETGKVYLVAENITKEESKNFLKHEVVHSALRQSPVYQKAIRALGRAKGTNRYKAAENAAIESGTPAEDMQEEILAYYIQNYKDSGIVKQFISKLRTWFRTTFGLNLSLDDVNNIVESMAKSDYVPQSTKNRGPVYARTGTTANFTIKRMFDVLTKYSNTDGTAGSAVAYVNPKDFIDATAVDPKDIYKASKEYYTLEKLRGNEQTPYLVVEKDGKDFRIVEHEGRHRMAYLASQGVTKAPIVVRTYAVFDTETTGLKDGGTLKGQWEGSGTDNMSISNPVDISFDNVDQLQDNFADSGAAGIKYSKQSVVDAANTWTGEKGYRPFTDTAAEGGFDTMRQDARVSMFDNLRHFMQDKNIELKRIQTGMKNLTEESNAYMKETLFHGRVKKRIDDFETEYVEPLLAKMNKSGKTMRQVGEYMHAKHAHEANALLKKRNPDLEGNDSLSGMSNAKADQILTKYANDTKIKDIAADVAAINRNRLKLLEQDELTTPAELKQWKKSYQNYVPLFREDFEGEGNFSPRGRGFNIQGQESQTRFGSERSVNPENIIPYILEASESTIVRGEKNKVGQALYKMAVNNPNQNVWGTNIMERKPTLDADGTTKYVDVMPNFSDDNVLSMKFNGVRKWVKFNKNNEYARRVVSSLKNLEAREQSKIVQAGLKINRFLAAVNTSFSPEFVISNFARDVQTAQYNLSDTEVGKMTKGIMKDTALALKGIHHALRGKKGDDTWATYFEAFEKAGGRTGWLDPYNTVEDRRNNLQRKLETLSGSHRSRAVFDAVTKYVDDANTAVENSVRLAAFVHARKLPNVSDARAAQIAKELTVNFNRRGEWGVAMNAMYLFYNASVQGTMRMFQALKHKRTQKMVGATIAAAIAMDMLNRVIGGMDDDDDKFYYDKIQNHVKDRNMIFMIPNSGGKFIKMPLPWGYNLFHVMGQEVGSAMASSMGMKPDYDTVSSTMRILGAGVEAFNPVQDGSLLMTMSPTVLDPLVKTYTNTDWHGGPLAPEGNPFGRQRPDSQMFFSGASKMSRSAAEFLNSITGGDKVRPGAVDISPETLDMIWDTGTGAAGRLLYDAIDTPIKALSGEETEARDWPITRKVMGSTTDQDDKNAYYDRVNDVLLVGDQMKYYRGDALKSKDLRTKYRNEFKLLRYAQSIDKMLAKLRRRRNQARKAGDAAAVKRINEASLRLMKTFNARYNKVMG